MTWLDTVKNDLASMSEKEIIEPTTEIGANDVVIRPLENLELKKLFTLVYKSRLAIDTYTQDARPKAKENKEFFLKAAAVLHTMQEEHSALKKILRISLRQEFNWPEILHLDLRKGWIVVRIDFIDDFTEKITNAIWRHRP